MEPRPRIIVQKYGGSSVATPEKLRHVAKLVCARKRSGFEVVVVVSAMGGATDDLLRMAKEIAGEPDRRELDMLLSVGERISMSLLAMAIREEGEAAVSLTGSQSGIITTSSHTNARIMEVRPFRVQDELEKGQVVIVAGYQGVSYKREITTLGRGGSDTTAIALAAALDAEACEIYSDVDGVYSADPRVVPDARRLSELGYEEMQALAEAGAKVLNPQAVEFAKARGIAIYAKKTGSPEVGTVVRKDLAAPSSGVRGIAHETALASITGRGAHAAQVRALLEALEGLGARVKQAMYSGDQFSGWVGLDDVHQVKGLKRAVEGVFGPTALRMDLGSVSLIGEGIDRDASTLSQALGVLEAEKVEVGGMSTSAFRITFLVPSPDVTRSVQALHRALW